MLIHCAVKTPKTLTFIKRNYDSSLKIIFSNNTYSTFQLCSFYMAVCFCWTLPYLILVTYRNLFGPLGATSAMIMNSCKIFGSLCCLVTFFEIMLVWYILKMVLKIIPHMDDKNWAKLLIVVNVLIISSVTYIMMVKGRKMQYYSILHTGGYPKHHIDSSENFVTIR